MSSSYVLSDNGASSGTAGIKSGGGTDGTLQLQTTTSGGVATTAVTVDNSQNVGIGTSSPACKLNVVSAGDRPLQVTAGTDTPAVFTGTGNNAYIQLTGSAGVFLGSVSGAFTMTTNGSERARIDTSGNLLIGYTSSNGSYKLQVNSQIFATSSTIATSDQNYKTNVTPLTGMLDLVSKLNPVQFNWKQHKVHDFDTTNPTVGFLAQEVQSATLSLPFVNSLVKESTCVITPEVKDEHGNITTPAVTENFLGIAEGNMIAILTKAIQELKAEFDAYKAAHP